MNVKNQTKYEQLVKEALDKISNPRTREIISLRFGLSDGNRQTLEAAGAEYGITRERVRQVEESAFFTFKEKDTIKKFKPVFSKIDSFLKKEGGLIKEERLFSEMTGLEHPHPERGSLYFILTLNPSCQRFVETDNFYPCWAVSREVFDKANKLITDLAKEINKDKKPVSFEDLYKLSKQKGYNFTKKALASYLDACKAISQNSFGEYGLSKWSEINPRGARDKAYIVLKQKGQPLHFKEVAALISENGLGKNPAQPQTVHNELIKDNRFVLVGRGTYALNEWGYRKGTVKEVIADVLRKKGPLTREQVIEEVLKNRYVKPNTILINLQNRKYFIRNQGNKYQLR